jgi:hypothetical protein
MKRVSLQTEFCNDELEHFTYYDYLKQACLNGQLSSFKETIKEINNEGIIRLNQNMVFNGAYLDAVENEALERMK